MKKHNKYYYARMLFNDGCISKECLLGNEIELIETDPIIIEASSLLLNHSNRKRGTMVIAGNGDIICFDVDSNANPSVKFLIRT